MIFPAIARVLGCLRILEKASFDEVSYNFLQKIRSWILNSYLYSFVSNPIGFLAGRMLEIPPCLRRKSVQTGSFFTDTKFFLWNSDSYRVE